jgi:hypothetical protein
MYGEAAKPIDAPVSALAPQRTPWVATGIASLLTQSALQKVQCFLDKVHHVGVCVVLQHNNYHKHAVNFSLKKKVKLSLQQAMQAYRIVIQ